MKKYNWIEDTDSDNNTIWLLQSPYEEGFKFRLKQRLIADNIEWFEAHDPELMGDKPDWWLNIGEAKAAIEQCYRNILLDDSL